MDEKTKKLMKETEEKMEEQEVERGNLIMDINHNSERTKDMDKNSILFEIALQLNRIANLLESKK